MTAISTSGQAKQIFAADEATVSVYLNWEAKTHKEANSYATKLHNDFAAKLRAQVEKEKLSKLTISQLRVRSAERWLDKKTEKYFVASSSFSFSITDFELLEQLLGEVSKTEGLSESNLNWGLSDEQLQRALPPLQRAALQDALNKAENYASALGTKGIKVLAVYEPGTEPPKPRGFAQPMMRMAVADMAMESAPSIEASEITLVSRVNIDAETI
ncbi:MAG: SIMPL domain-containing protein [Microbacteriaceae bacterium]|nr:SIMPL domain-containing protein [Microbacteriaceae bacterium]